MQDLEQYCLNDCDCFVIDELLSFEKLLSIGWFIKYKVFTKWSLDAIITGMFHYSFHNNTFKIFILIYRYIFIRLLHKFCCLVIF